MVLLSTVDSTTSSFILMILGILFVVLFSFLAVVTIRVRKQAQKMLQIGFNFAYSINDGTRKLYYLYKGSSINIVDDNGLAVSILPDVRHEIFIQGFTPNSMIPDSAYRLTVETVDLKENNDGSTAHPSTLQIVFRPARNDYSTWTIVKEEDDYLLLEHPLMGKLHFPKGIIAAHIGHTITLVSVVEKVTSGTWRLTYKPV